MKLMHFRIPLALCAVLLLSGCAAATANAVLGKAGSNFYQYFSQDDPNLIEKNYAAADYLVQQATTFIRKDRDVIKASPLTDIEEPEVFTTIAKVIPEQVGTRLSQLGYKVDMSEVSEAVDEVYLQGINVKQDAARFILSGTYRERDRSNLDVSLRIVDVKTGRFVGGFDYILPVRGGLRELSKPETRIFRVEPAQENP